MITEFVKAMNDYVSFNIFLFVSGYISRGSKEAQAKILANRDWIAGLLRLMGSYLGQKRGTQLSSEIAPTGLGNLGRLINYQVSPLLAFNLF